MSDEIEPVEATNHPGHVWTQVQSSDAKSAQMNMANPSKQETIKHVFRVIPAN